MAKIIACNVQPGMKFKITSQDTMPFAMQIGKECYFDGGVRVQTGVDLIITKTPYKKYNIQLVNFKIDGTDDEFCSYWSIFRDNTELIEGEAVETRKPFKVLTDGPFNGFDIVVEDVKLEDYIKHLGHGTINIKFKFVGKAEGKGTGNKFPTTKVINYIKSAPGFKDHMIKLIHEELDKNIDQINKFIRKGNISKYTQYHSSGHCLGTRYSGGRLMIRMDFMTDINTLKQGIDSLLDRFIQSKATSV